MELDSLVFTPTINDKNVVCLKNVDGTACSHLMKWSPSERNKRGRGTSAMSAHIQNSCQAERNCSALARLIGDLRSNMLASKVERMMFIEFRLNRHFVDDVHELDALNAQARARVTKNALKSAPAHQERSSMSVGLALKMSRMAM